MKEIWEQLYVLLSMSLSVFLAADTIFVLIIHHFSEFFFAMFYTDLLLLPSESRQRCLQEIYDFASLFNCIIA